MNKNKLMGKMAETGRKKGDILVEACISYGVFWRKMRGLGEFSVGEVDRLSCVLGLTSDERDDIFFARDVHI